jgi:hypothetical protein
MACDNPPTSIRLPMPQEKTKNLLLSWVPQAGAVAHSGTDDNKTFFR